MATKFLRAFKKQRLTMKLPRNLRFVVKWNTSSPNYDAFYFKFGVCFSTESKALQSMALQRMDHRLYEAAKSGNLITVIILLEKNPHVLDQVTPQNNTALHLAATAGNANIVKHLLHLKPDISKVTNKKGNTALHEAAKAGHYQVVVDLTHHDEQLPCELNRAGETALFIACEGGHSPVAKYLMAVAPLSAVKRSTDGRTCLHAVLFRGDEDLANELLDRRSNLAEMVDNHGTTALHIATSGGNLDIVKRILNLYPDLCYNLNRFHRSALHLAVTNGSLEIIQELLSRRPDSIEILTMDGKNILHLAAESNQLKTVDYLLETVDMLEFLNETDQKGNTPLHLATHAKKSKMVKRLVSVPGVNVNAVNNAGFTPLDIARRNTEYYDSPEILEALDEAGGKSGSDVCRNSNSERDYVKGKRYRRYFDRLREGYKNRANMATLVAVLIATVSFTAAFTVPGGFKSDGNDQGTATLTGATAFKVFLIFDTLAFFASVIVILAWMTCTSFSTKDLWLLTSASSIIVWIALISVTISFVAAMYTVVAPKCRWIAVMVCVVGGGAIVIGTLLFSVVNGYVKENRVRMQRLLGVDFTGEEIKLQRVPWTKYIRRCRSILTRRRSFNDSPYVSTELEPLTIVEH